MIDYTKSNHVAGMYKSFPNFIKIMVGENEF